MQRLEGQYIAVPGNLLYAMIGLFAGLLLGCITFFTVHSDLSMQSSYFTFLHWGLIIASSVFTVVITCTHPRGMERLFVWLTYCLGFEMATQVTIVEGRIMGNPILMILGLISIHAGIIPTIIVIGISRMISRCKQRTQSS